MHRVHIYLVEDMRTFTHRSTTTCPESDLEQEWTLSILMGFPRKVKAIQGIRIPRYSAY